MFNVSGKIINFFNSPASEKYEASYKIQLLGEMPLQDGQCKMEMLNLNIPKPLFDSLQGQIGEEVTLPIGFYVKNNQLITFFPKHTPAKNLSTERG